MDHPKTIVFMTVGDWDKSGGGWGWYHLYNETAPGNDCKPGWVGKGSRSGPKARKKLCENGVMWLEMDSWGGFGRPLPIWWHQGWCSFRQWDSVYESQTGTLVSKSNLETYEGAMSRGLHFGRFWGPGDSWKYVSIGGGDGNSVVATFLSENPSGAPMIWRAGSVAQNLICPRLGSPPLWLGRCDPEVFVDHNGPHRK